MHLVRKTVVIGGWQESVRAIILKNADCANCVGLIDKEIGAFALA